MQPKQSTQSQPSKETVQQQKAQAPKSQQKPKENLSLNDKKRKLQNIWKWIFIFISIGSTIFFQKIYQYQTLQYFATIRKGSLSKLCQVGIPFAIFFMLADSLSHRIFDPLCDKYYISHEKYPIQEARKKRCYTIVKWGYSMVYYIIVSVFAYLILLDTSYMPTFLGGNGYCTDFLRYVNSFDEATSAMGIYYGIQFGKHFGRFFQHVFIRPEGNFYQYTLHHSLSMFLIFFSYMMNFWLPAIFILMIHDFSDFFLIFPRAYRDYRNIYKPLLQLQYVLMAVSWIGCRIFLHSYCAVYTSIKDFYIGITHEQEIGGQTVVDVMQLPAVLMIVMICSLQILQIFWTYHIITSFIEVTVSSKLAKHTYD